MSDPTLMNIDDAQADALLRYVALLLSFVGADDAERDGVWARLQDAPEDLPSVLRELQAQAADAGRTAAPVVHMLSGPDRRIVNAMRTGGAGSAAALPVLRAASAMDGETLAGFADLVQEYAAGAADDLQSFSEELASVMDAHRVRRQIAADNGVKALARFSKTVDDVERLAKIKKHL